MSKHALTIDDHTRAQQGLASNPAHSAWVSANAGSGKTFVLSRRVVRLLLNRTAPSRILCLTFTKAAAGEMSNRVFEILGKWAVMPEDDLVKELEDVEGKPPSAAQILTARTLFAEALETPGGLKIQTIHAFCEALLHQFPLEANVPGHFTVMDEGVKRQLVEDARRTVLLEADAKPDSVIGKAFTRVMDFASDFAIEKVMGEIVSQHEQLGRWLDDIGGPDAAEQVAKSRFQFSPDDTLETLQTGAVGDSLFSQSELEQIARLGAQSDKVTDQKLAVRVQSFLASDDAAEQLDSLNAIFLTEKKTPRSFRAFATKNIKDQMPDLEENLAGEGVRLVESELRINTFRSIEETTPLLEITQSVITLYRNAKKRRGLLDFDDLVARSADLLTRQSARQWVLYKLDLGIDHILLDEAQDTSPRQWQILDALVEEFFSGDSARPINRTIFAVGDEKQSIYSFQGAEPERFARQRKSYSNLAKGVERPLQNVRLGLSFRSTQDVLSAVDEVFASPENAKGITFDEAPPPHTAARRNQPGSVEVWPLLLKEDPETPEAWETPQDQFSTSHPAVRLADKIATQIADWLGDEKLEANGRLIGAGDILVLVRARDRFMLALNRALKERDIPVAGADRLSLTDHIAVQDLMALGQVMLTPEDDLSLAAVLKCPLIGLSEEQLYILARSRLHEAYETSLFEALTLAKDDPQFAGAYEKLSLWRSRVDHLPTYEFYGHLLGVDGGRKAFYSRLGPEAEDVLDAFLGQILTHEQAGLPGLQAFLSALADDAPEIKREMDKSAGEVRIMTVHAAKGLEAPIVFLVDKCSKAFQGAHAPALYHWGGEETSSGYLWVPEAAGLGDATMPLRDKIEEKSKEEYRRLLYVGMTRAEDRLIICGYGPKPNSKGEVNLPDPNWHNIVSNALATEWEDVHDAGGALLHHRWQQSDPISVSDDPDTAELYLPDPITLPDWISEQLPTENTLPRPLSPSGAQALIDETLTAPKSFPSLLADRNTEQGHDPRHRGVAVHRLLQVLPDLPESQRGQAGQNYLAKALPEMTDEARENLLKTVEGAITSLQLAPYFSPATSRAEVPIMGQIKLLSGPRSVAGIIDRLAVLDGEVILLDYKTSPYFPRTAEDIAPDYITQMALYRELVAKIYPDKTISTALVWTSATDGPRIMNLPNATLDAALNKISKL